MILLFTCKLISLNHWCIDYDIKCYIKYITIIIIDSRAEITVIYTYNICEFGVANWFLFPSGKVAYLFIVILVLVNSIYYQLPFSHTFILYI